MTAKTTTHGQTYYSADAAPGTPYPIGRTGLTMPATSETSVYAGRGYTGRVVDWGVDAISLVAFVRSGGDDTEALIDAEGPVVEFTSDVPGTQPLVLFFPGQAVAALLG